MKKLLDISKLTPKKLHLLGSNAREKDNHLGALQYLDHAIIGYQRENNYEGIVDALKDRTLTWKRFFLLTQDRVFAILARKDAETMLEITKEKDLKNKYSTSYFRLGEVSMLFENYQDAIKNYKKALEVYEGSLAEKGDFRYHLGEAVYRNGKKKQGKEVMLEGLNEIRKGAKKVPNFLIHVWESGCHLRLARLLRVDEPKEAQKYLELAKKIINDDEKLVIRKRQLNEVEKSFLESKKSF